MRRVTKLPTITSKYEHDLTWALQPIFVWLQVLGIPTGQIHLASTIRRYAFFLAGMTMMIWVICSNLQQILKHTQAHTNEPNKKWSLTRIWSEALQELLVHSVSILISLSLFIISQLRWTSMWQNAIEVEQRIRFDKKFYHSIRKISIAASMILAVVSKFQFEMFHLFQIS